MMVVMMMTKQREVDDIGNQNKKRDKDENIEQVEEDEMMT